jgi:hypothetical protein
MSFLGMSAISGEIAEIAGPPQKRQSDRTPPGVCSLSPLWGGGRGERAAPCDDVMSPIDRPTRNAYLRRLATEVPRMTTLLMLGMAAGLFVVWAAVLGMLTRRSCSIGRTFGQSLAAVVLCSLLGAIFGWLLNPFQPGLAPIAVIVRGMLIVAITALGNVRIIEFVLKTTYGHAWYLWSLSTIISGAIGYAVYRFVM